MPRISSPPRTLLLATLLSSLLARGSPASPPLEAEALNPSTVPERMTAQLGRVALEARSSGVQAAVSLAHDLGLTVEEDRVQVTVEGDPGLDESRLAEAGAAVRSRYEGLFLCAVPVASLADVAAVEGVAWVRPPHRPIPCITSQGVALTGAAEWHAHGFTGAATKVAVIDVGFQGLSQAIAAGEIPSDVVTIDFTGYGMESLSRHGTAVAEIVHDMAPDASLVLINTYSEVDLGNAKDYCVSAGVRVINHSVGYANTGGHDGTGVVCAIADDAAQHGIFWSNAAGNHAFNHYHATFTDADGDSLHEFQGNPQVEHNSLGTLSPGQTLWIYLSWRSWPTTAEDYDLHLCRREGGAWTVVASSVTRQTGSQPPTEEIGHSVSVPGEYGVAVRAYRTTRPNELTLLSAFHPLQFFTPQGSLLQPADAVGAFAAGALAKENWTTGPQEPSSSQGPTYDGRVKPEIVGPVRVATWAGGSGFAGTSAASPHVAGAAALIVGAFPDWSLQQVGDCLASHAIDMGPPGRDTVYGWGRLDLPLSIDVREVPAGGPCPSLLCVAPNPCREGTTISYVLGEQAEVTIEVYDVAGRCAGRLSLGPQDPGLHVAPLRALAGGARLGAGVYAIRWRAGSFGETRRLVVLP